MFRPVDGTNVALFVSYMYPHLVTEKEFNLTYLAKQLSKDAPAFKYGNNSTMTKIRAGFAVPPFSALYKAKFWQEA